MKSHPIVWQETKTVVLGQIICCGIMLAVYSLIGYLSGNVIRGALAGGFLAIANFFAMALCVDMAADRGGEEQSKGQTLVQLSYIGRMAVLFVVLALCAKSGAFDLIALVLPLAFVRPILTINELIRKKGVKQK